MSKYNCVPEHGIKENGEQLELYLKNIKCGGCALSKMKA